MVELRPGASLSLEGIRATLGDPVGPINGSRCVFEAGEAQWLWSGPALPWGELCERALEALSGREAAPQVIARAEHAPLRLMLMRAEGAPLTLARWSAVGRLTGLRALTQLAQSIALLHERGVILNLTRAHLVWDDTSHSLRLRAMPSLMPLGRRHAESVWPDLRVFCELLYELVLGRAYPGGHAVASDLQDRAAMRARGLLIAGVNQVMASCVTPHGELAYERAEQLVAGLEQALLEHDVGWELRVGARSSLGNHIFRRTNQDACGHLITQLVRGSRPQHAGFFCVADGIGGLADGERASALAVQSACEAFARAWVHEGGALLRDHPGEVARGVVKVASQQLALHGELAHPELRGGTTFSGLVISHDRGAIGHVGDSRIALVRAGRAWSLTREHTLAQILIEIGELTPQTFDSNHVSARTLARFLSATGELELRRVDGMEGCPDALPRDARGLMLEPGDLFVITSDGVHNEISLEELASLAAEHEGDPQALCDALIALALARAGRDNATALAVALCDRLI